MLQSNQESCFFQIGHVGLQFHSKEIKLLEGIIDSLSSFQVKKLEDQEETISITLIGLKKDQPIPFSVPDMLVPSFIGNEASYFEYRHLWIVQFNNFGMMIVNRINSKILAFAYVESLNCQWNMSIYLHPMFDLMRQKKLYLHHAAAVSYHDKGLLLAGKSGQGKTTLSMDLLHKGFNFLSDDNCFLRQKDNAFEIIGSYEPFKVFTSNINHLDKFQDLAESNSDVKYKIPLQITDYYKDQKISECQMHALVFPQWAPERKSSLESVQDSEALIELLPLTLVCFDPASSKAHFEFTSKLVQEMPCLRLYMGCDRESWHPLILNFLEKKILV